MRRIRITHGPSSLSSRGSLRSLTRGTGECRPVAESGSRETRSGPSVNHQPKPRYLAVSGIPRFAFATRITCVVKASIQTLVNRAGRPSLRNKSSPAISW